METQNNLQKEFTAALERQKVDPKFIIPIILEGDRSTSVAQNLPNIFFFSPFNLLWQFFYLYLFIFLFLF